MISFRSVLNLPNPLYSLIGSFEQEVARQPGGDSFLADEWPPLRRRFVLHALKLRKIGCRVQGALRPASAGVASALEEVYQLVLHNRYLTSQYWRAYRSFLQHDRLSPDYRLFGLAEAEFTSSQLTLQEIKELRASTDHPDFLDQGRLMELLVAIRPFIRREVRSRARYLQWSDPALYSEADLVGELECRLIMKLRNEPRLLDNEPMLYGWARRVVTNEIPNMLEFANSESRGKQRPVLGPDGRPLLQDGQPTYVAREVELNQTFEGGEIYEQYEAVEAVAHHRMDAEDQALCQVAFEKAPADIQRYLDTIWRGSPEFWEWFHRQEPELAARHLEEAGDIGPWVRRWLNLSAVRLLRFFDETLPDQKERVC